MPAQGRRRLRPRSQSGRLRSEPTFSVSLSNADGRFGNAAKRNNAGPKPIIPQAHKKDASIPTKRVVFCMQDSEELALGLPTREQYMRIEQEYLTSLSVRKREKALLSQVMFDDIWDVLHNPRDSKLRTPQFRFWVRKMFVLSLRNPASLSSAHEDSEGDLKPVVMHENRPVALKEQIYDIVSHCHHASGHGGRDRTMAVVRERYSWIPKELIAQFVKACPTCVYKKTKDRGLASALSAQAISLDGNTATVQENPTGNLELPLANTIEHSSSAESTTTLWSLGGLTWPDTETNATPKAHQAVDRNMHETLCLPPLVSRAGSSTGSGSGYGAHSVFMGIGSPQQSSHGWLASLASGPGPNCMPAPMSMLPLLPQQDLTLPPMRRAESENDAHPLRTSGSRVTLPPLLKALSDSGAEAMGMRPQYGVVDAFKVPPPLARMAGSTSSSGSCSGSRSRLGIMEDTQYEDRSSHGDDGHGNFGMDFMIDPSLLEPHTALSVSVNDKGKAPALGYNAHFAMQQHQLQRAANCFGDAPRLAVTATPVKLPHRTLIHAESHPGYSVLTAENADSHNLSSNPSAGSIRSDGSGGSANTSFDAQDWELRYVLDSSPP